MPRRCRSLPLSLTTKNLCLRLHLVDSTTRPIDYCRLKRIWPALLQRHTRWYLTMWKLFKSQTWGGPNTSGMAPQARRSSNISNSSAISLQDMTPHRRGRRNSHSGYVTPAERQSRSRTRTHSPSRRITDWISNTDSAALPPIYGTFLLPVGRQAGTPRARSPAGGQLRGASPNPSIHVPSHDMEKIVSTARAALLLTEKRAREALAPCITLALHSVSAGDSATNAFVSGQSVSDRLFVISQKLSGGITERLSQRHHESAKTKFSVAFILELARQVYRQLDDHRYQQATPEQQSRWPRVNV